MNDEEVAGEESPVERLSSGNDVRDGCNGRRGSGLIREMTMEVGDFGGCVGEVRRRLPSIVLSTVTFPANQVLHPASLSSRVDDFFNFILCRAVDYVWRGRGRALLVRRDGRVVRS